MNEILLRKGVRRRMNEMKEWVESTKEYYDEKTDEILEEIRSLKEPEKFL